MNDTAGIAMLIVIIATWVLQEVKSRKLRHEAEYRAHLSRLMIQKAPIGMGITALDGRILRINEAFAKIVGRSKTELLTDVSWRDITHKDDLTMDVLLAEQVLSRAISGYTIAKRYVQPNGRIVPVRLTVVGLWTPEGEFRNFLIYAEARAAHVELARSWKGEHEVMLELPKEQI